MPINIVFRDGLWCPIFVCSVCSKEIQEHGNFEYLVDVNTERIISEIFFTHKGCSWYLRNTLKPEPKDQIWFWNELANLPTQLYSNFRWRLNHPLAMILELLDCSMYEPTDINDPILNNAGVYFLFDGDDLVYIGQSVNARIRLHERNHPIRSGKYAIKFIRMPDEKRRLAIEKGLIALLNPELNITNNIQRPTLRLTYEEFNKKTNGYSDK